MTDTEYPEGTAEFHEALPGEVAVSLDEALTDAAEEKARNVELAGRQASGLRALAEMIEQNPEVAPLARYYLTTLSVFSSQTSAHHALLARLALRHGAKVDKSISEELYNLQLSFAEGAVVAHALATRAEVCERVSTGVKVVTKTVKDPGAVAALPDVEVTEEVETFDWVCKPVMSTLDASGAME